MWRQPVYRRTAVLLVDARGGLVSHDYLVLVDESS